MKEIRMLRTSLKFYRGQFVSDSVGHVGAHGSPGVGSQDYSVGELDGDQSGAGRHLLILVATIMAGAGPGRSGLDNAGEFGGVVDVGHLEKFGLLSLPLEQKLLLLISFFRQKQNDWTQNKIRFTLDQAAVVP